MNAGVEFLDEKKNLHDEHTGETITRTACKDRLLLINTARRWCRDVYLQTVMRFFRSTQTLRADAFFDVRPIAIAVCIQPDSIQRRPRGLFVPRPGPLPPRALSPTNTGRPLRGVTDAATVAAGRGGGRDLRD